MDDTLIDAHTHIGQVREDRPPMTPEQMLSWMDEHGIDQAILLPLVSPEATSRYILTSTTLDYAAEHPDRFIPFCNVDPRMYVQGGRDGFESRIRQWVEQGARGFGEIKVGLPVDHDNLQMIYDICGELDLPVLLHIDHRRCTDDVGLPNFERMIDRYDDVDFIAHAPGWWAHISAGIEAGDVAKYPSGDIDELGRCDELLQTYDNLYADLSAQSAYNALTRDEPVGQRFLERNYDKLLFATDYLYPDQEIPQLDLFDRFSFDEDMRRNVSHRNVERILR
jgi:predicted TIM-barrel fold metal-dependent hydrolase